MQGDDPPYLPVGTAVSAKYKGAFCEAKVSKVVRVVKCKITYKMGLGTATVTDEHIRGPLRVGHTVQARHSEKKDFIEATISKIQDCSQYTVVFDDGDITTLRRTALCLKSGRHFNESETLDQLPLTHPEHFGNPVVGGRRGRRSRQLKEDSSEGEAEDETEPDLDLYSGDIGKVVCVEASDKKKSRDNWFPGLVVVPSAQPTVRINVREEFLVRSFKDGRYYTVPKKEILEFSRQMGNQIENTALAEAMEKAIRYLDHDELPAHWERGPLFDVQIPESDSDENYSDSSDDEPREVKDHFVAQLYKFMDDRGTPLNKNPTIANRDIDLYRLFRLVHKIGGYNRVTNQNKWRSVSIRLGYPHNHATYNSVKQAYKKFLLNFEDFFRKLGCTMLNNLRNDKKNRGRSLIRDRDRATPINSSPRPDRSKETVEVPIEKKEEIEKSPEPKPKAKPEPVKVKIEKEVEPEKVVKKKELSVEPTDSSNSSSDVTIDVQSDSGQGTSKETPKPKKAEVKNIKERKVKAAVGEKVKALVEKFEEQAKKEETKPEESKVEEKEKPQQTRSKSLGPRSKDVASPDRREIPREVATRTPKPVKKPEEDKKRGRKRKDTEEKSTPEPAPESPVSTQPVNVGDKLKVYYGPTHESKVTYEAKVLEIEREGTGSIYLVHYTGWNTRYDEWIKPARIAENLSLTTKAKRLKQSQGTAPKTTNPAKPAAKRGRGMSVSSRNQDPPRSTTPSSVTSSSSRTKSPATPASKSARVTRQGDVNRRTRRTSAMSIASESESEHSESESELSRTRSGSKNDEPTEKPTCKKKLPPKKKEDEDTEKEEENEKPKRVKRLVKKATDVKVSADSDDDSSSPPKGRDFDLNQIRSELKGFEKAVKITSTELTENIFEDKPATSDPKPSTSSAEKKIEEKTKPEKQVDKIVSTDDIYEFKEPEPFEFERGPKLNEDKNAKKRLVPRLFDELEKPDKSPKKKGGKSPPKIETKDEEKKRPFRRTPNKKIEEEGEKSPPKEDLTLKLCEDPFDKLVESPSFNLSNSLLEKKPDLDSKSKVVKTLNLDEPLSLFRELPETVGEDSGDRLDLSDTDDTQTEPLFSHKEQLFSDSAFTKSETSSLDPIFRGFNSKLDSDDLKKRGLKDTSDEEDPIGAAIHRAMTHTMTDEESSNDDLFITQPTSIYQPKLSSKETSPILMKKDILEEEEKDTLVITTEVKDIKTSPKESNTSKQISPALQETDSSLLEAISLQTAELLKKEEVKEPTIKTGTKIADSILQKFNMIKKKEEIKPIKVEIKQEPIEKSPDIDKEIKIEETPDVKEPIPESTIKIETVLSDFPLEIKKRSAKKIVSREFIEESDSDSSDSEQRLVIARSDEDSQTNVSEKLDFKDTDSNISTLQVNTDDTEERESIFKFEETKTEEPVVENIPANAKTDTSEAVKQEEDQDNNISLLLCKETIPGSPAPVPEVTATTESRVKPKSAKSLLLEMPFASAPGSSNSKGLLANPVEHKPPQKAVVKPEPQPLAIPLEPSCEVNETSNAVINTPPTTPESTISNLSPRGDQDRISPNAADNESCKSTDSGPREQPNKVSHYSEEDTLMNSESCPAPKKVLKEDNAAPCRKRRRSCKTTEEPVPAKRGRRPLVRNVRTNSDSDDTSEHSAPGSTPPSAHSTANHNSISGETRLSSRSPRPSKYNFIIELDPSMECTQRISLLQQKLSELRKTYNNVKTELACIDRRRKKLRRREREALKAAKQEMACA